MRRFPILPLPVILILVVFLVVILLVILVVVVIVVVVTRQHLLAWARAGGEEEKDAGRVKRVWMGYADSLGCFRVSCTMSVWKRSGRARWGVEGGTGTRTPYTVGRWGSERTACCTRHCMSDCMPPIRLSTLSIWNEAS